MALRVWVEMMGPGKNENVGKFQSVLITIDLIIFTYSLMARTGASYTLQALVMAGRGDIALAMAMREEEPSWGYMVKQGPGTIWESCEPAVSILESVNID
jgi:hypothetical protein